MAQTLIASASPRSFRLLPSDKRIGWVPYAWLIYLPNFFIAPVLYRASVMQWAATGVATAIFLVSYFVGHWVRGPRLVAVVAVNVLLAVVFSPFNAGAATFFVYAVSFAARLERPRDGLRSVLLVTLLGVGTALAFSTPIYHWIIVVVVTPLIGAVNLHFAQVARSDDKLRLAHEEIERLATVAERERIARDLHDVLGHTLTLIVLKTELASKLADRDPARAVREIRDVEQISRTALADVRNAISGYRATWADEVAHARSMLEAAGIRGEFTGQPAALARGIEETLALVVREAITNVVRHARATVCQVRWEHRGEYCRLDVIDDGRGGAFAEGNGLRGLRERVESLGGSVAWQAVNGMRLAVTLPASR